MKFPQALLFLLAFITTIHALALPASLQSISDSSKELFKRKGGGGGGGRGGGGGGSRSGGSTSSSGGSRSGSSSSSGGSRSGSSSSSGSSRTSGSPRTFGGGSYYGGGAATPYRAGASRGSISPVLIGGGAALLLFPALAYGAYSYGYPGTYRYHNETSDQDETHPIDCYCQKASQCGCDPNNNTDYLNAVANNQSVAKLVNNTLVIDGTLDNDTTATTSDTGAASSLQQGLYEMSGLWIVVAGVTYTMWFM